MLLIALASLIVKIFANYTKIYLSISSFFFLVLGEIEDCNCDDIVANINHGGRRKKKLMQISWRVVDQAARGCTDNSLR